MKNLIWIAGLALLLGAGCSSAKTPAPATLTKEQVVTQYAQASVMQGKEMRYTVPDTGKSVSLTLPSDWIGDGPLWRPHADGKDSVRVQYFAKEIADQEWTKQQQSDAHQLLQATKEKDRYLLIVHHVGLKAILVKVFVPDPEHTVGYAFGECRIMDEQKDDALLWSACKTAIESIH